MLGLDRLRGMLQLLIHHIYHALHGQANQKYYHSNENGSADTRFPIFCQDVVVFMRMAREVLKVEKKETNQDMTSSVTGTLKFLSDRYLR